MGAKKAKGFSRVVPPASSASSASSSALVSFDGLGLDADLMTSESRSADVPPPSSSVDLLLDLEGLDLSATPAPPPPVAESSLLAIEPMIQEPQEKVLKIRRFLSSHSHFLRISQ